jgi:hypothetical protein
MRIREAQKHTESYGSGSATLTNSKDPKIKPTFGAVAGLIAGPVILPADTTAQQQVRRRR